VAASICSARAQSRTMPIFANSLAWRQIARYPNAGQRALNPPLRRISFRAYAKRPGGGAAGLSREVCRLVRRRPTTNESTRGWRRRSNAGRALRTCFMLANASIQNTTTLQGLLSPLSAASQLMPSLRRIPRLDPRFRAVDTCWLGRSRRSSCFEGLSKCHRNPEITPHSTNLARASHMK
jgi:hypothetical protein